MSICRNVFRVTQAILEQNGQGCSFKEVLELTPEDMNESDVLLATIAGVAGKLLYEKGDRIFVLKSTEDRMQELCQGSTKVIQEEAAGETLRSDVGYDVTNHHAVNKETGCAGNKNVWSLLDNEPEQMDGKAGSEEENMNCMNNMNIIDKPGYMDYRDNKDHNERMISQAESHNSSVDDPEWDDEMTVADSQDSQSDAPETLHWSANVPDNDLEARRSLFMKESDLSDINQGRGVSAKNDAVSREANLPGKRMAAGDSISDVTPPAKQMRMSRFFINNKWYPLFVPDNNMDDKKVDMDDKKADMDDKKTDMDEKKVDKDKKDSFVANATRSVFQNDIYSPTDMNEERLTEKQMALFGLNTEIFRYGEKVYRNKMLAQLGETATEEKACKPTQAIPTQPTTRTVFKRKYEHEQNKTMLTSMSNKFGKMNIRNEAVTKNNPMGVSKTSCLSTTTVRIDHYDPRYEFLKYLRLSERELAKFDREGERVPSCSEPGSEWSEAEYDNNCGNFYKDVSWLDEDDHQIDYWETVVSAVEGGGDMGGVPFFDFYS